MMTAGRRKMTKNEKMLSLVAHLYWFYNADMKNFDNQNDFKKNIEELELLIKQEE